VVEIHFLFNRKDRKDFRKVTQRYILKLCDICGNSALSAVHFYDAETPTA